MEEGKEIFVRKASGLVREMSWFESMLTNYNGVGTIWLAAFTAFFIYYAVPRMDAKLAVFGVFLLGVFGYLTTYAMLTASWPRSGAPYVAETRILHPSIGFMSEMGLVVCIIASWGIVPSTLLIYWGLMPGIYTAGLLGNNPGLISLSAQLADPLWMSVIGTIFYLATLIPCILGTKKMVRNFQIPMTVITLSGVFAMIILLAVTTQTAFVDRFSTLIGQSPTAIVTAAQETVPDALLPVLFTPIIILMGLGVCGSSTNTYWNAWTVGEMKDAANVKKQFLSFNLAGLLSAATIILLLWLEETVAGRPFMVAASQLSILAPEKLSESLLYGG